MSEQLQELPPPLGRHNSNAKQDSDSGFSFPQDMDTDAAGPSRVRHASACVMSSCCMHPPESMGKCNAALKSSNLSSIGFISVHSPACAACWQEQLESNLQHGLLCQAGLC